VKQSFPESSPFLGYSVLQVRDRGHEAMFAACVADAKSYVTKVMDSSLPLPNSLAVS